MDAKTTISHDLIAELPEFEGRFGETITVTELHDARRRKAKADKQPKTAASTVAPKAPATPKKRASRAKGAAAAPAKKQAVAKKKGAR